MRNRPPLLCMAKQTIADRKKRLSQGRCPIHGHYLVQASEWQVDEETGRLYTFVECPRCKDVMAIETKPFGPATLLPAFQHLLSLPATA